MASPAPAIDAELEAVTAALAAVEPRTKRLLLFGSRARGDARPDSDVDVLVVMGAADASASRAPAGMWWRGPCGKEGSCMSPAEDALLRLCCAGPHRRRAHTPAWGGARATSASRNF